ncbi:MAG: hypothetical protein NT001_04415, partial [Candidatus Woesearchaeota archaeon]|nr:hypothetical protein [Candidatus Woesearchaeota archaeon]
MEKTGIILAGLPGDMATRINTVIGETDGVYLSSISGFQGVSQTHPFALTGYEIKGKLIDNEFKERYLREKGIRLISPDAHHEVVKMVGGAYGSVLAGISFTTPEGYLATGKLFAENRIPFVLGGTGAIPEQEKELEEMVLKA